MNYAFIITRNKIYFSEWPMVLWRDYMP